jgi:hypothetical protein
MSDVAARADGARRIAAARASDCGLAPLLPRLDRHRDALDDPWLERARVLIDLQLDAIRTGDLGGAIAATMDLIGLGVGLTPSGDDYLVGFLAGLEASRQPGHPALAAAIAANAPSRTTEIGASMLIHAARGEYAERLHDVLLAIASPSGEELDRAIVRALAYGATSGADTLVGLLAAMDVAAAPAARTAARAAQTARSAA